MQRQEPGTSLEIRKGKKVNCVQRDFPAPGFKSASQASSQKLVFTDPWLGCCAGSPEGVQAPTTPIICCWLPKSCLLPLLACWGRRSASFSRCLLLSSFLHLSHPLHSLPSSSRSRFCIHASPTYYLAYTLPFFLSLPTYPRAFLTSALTPLSPELLTSNLL